MEKAQRKSDIGMMSIVAAMVKQCMDKPGICAIGSPAAAEEFPSVHMTPKCFLEYFGEDTEFEYSEDDPEFRTMSTIVNGVLFYALLDGFDIIEDGRLVA